MFGDAPYPSIPAEMIGVHLEEDILGPAIVDVEDIEEQMALNAAKNGDLTDIIGLYSHIIIVESINSDVPVPVPEPIPEMIEGNNTESE